MRSRATVDEDRDGRPLHGGARYELRFDVDRPPPVHGFWSLAVLGDGGCRARLGSDDGLTVSEDGSLTIHVQPRPPAAREQRRELARDSGRAVPARPADVLADRRRARAALDAAGAQPVGDGPACASSA
jgi:hypothetical protein